MRTDRNSIGVEIDPEYCRIIAKYLKAEAQNLFTNAQLRFESLVSQNDALAVRENRALYSVHPSKRKLEE